MWGGSQAIPSSEDPSIPPQPVGLHVFPRVRHLPHQVHTFLSDALTADPSRQPTILSWMHFLYSTLSQSMTIPLPLSEIGPEFEGLISDGNSFLPSGHTIESLHKANNLGEKSKESDSSRNEAQPTKSSNEMTTAQSYPPPTISNATPVVKLESMSSKQLSRVLSEQHLSERVVEILSKEHIDGRVFCKLTADMLTQPPFSLTAYELLRLTDTKEVLLQQIEKQEQEIKLRDVLSESPANSTRSDAIPTPQGSHMSTSSSSHRQFSGSDALLASQYARLKQQYDIHLDSLHNMQQHNAHLEAQMSEMQRIVQDRTQEAENLQEQLAVVSLQYQQLRRINSGADPTTGSAILAAGFTSRMQAQRDASIANPSGQEPTFAVDQQQTHRLPHQHTVNTRVGNDTLANYPPNSKPPQALSTPVSNEDSKVDLKQKQPESLDRLTSSTKTNQDRSSTSLQMPAYILSRERARQHVVLATEDGRLSIWDAWNPQGARVVAQVPAQPHPEHGRQFRHTAISMLTPPSANDTRADSWRILAVATTAAVGAESSLQVWPTRGLPNPSIAARSDENPDAQTPNKPGGRVVIAETALQQETMYCAAQLTDEAVAVGQHDGQVQVWRMSGGGVEARRIQLHASGYVQGPSSAVLSLCAIDGGAHGRLLAAGGSLYNGSDCRILVWDAATLRLLTALTGHRSHVRALAPCRLHTSSFRSEHGPNVGSGSGSGSGDSLLSAAGSVYGDKTMRLWDLRAAPDTPAAIMRGHLLPLTACCHIPDSYIVASGADDRSIRLWDLRKPDSELRSIKAHGFNVSALQAVPMPWSLISAGTRSTSSPVSPYALLSASRDRTVRLWDIESGEQLAMFSDPTHPILAMTCFNAVPWDN
eukprot:TRINITY_DN937_c1_g2_i1.p1 TRINITY_DN937_c1_g2~~TRINITY_DN937_c1_g2_i1.p1  ORF type:complete len:875 (-),score=178.13 TRINITY_DN937_c1_g2_i1:187-2811(-)